MKLTKVLVGLLAVSLCGAAVAVKKTRSVGVDTRTQGQLTAAELYSLFLKEVRKSTPDKNVLTDLFNTIMTKIEGRGLLVNSMKSDLREYNTGLDFFALESAWDKAFRAKKTLPVTKKTEIIIKQEEIKKEEGSKPGAWDTAKWGAEPAWNDELLKTWASKAALLALEDTLTGDNKKMAAAMVYALDNKKFTKTTDNGTFYDSWAGSVGEFRSQI